MAQVIYEKGIENDKVADETVRPVKTHEVLVLHGKDELLDSFFAKYFNSAVYVIPHHKWTKPTDHGRQRVSMYIVRCTYRSEEEKVELDIYGEEDDQNEMNY